MKNLLVISFSLLIFTFACVKNKDKKMLLLLTSDSSKHWLYNDKPTPYKGKIYYKADTFAHYYRLANGLKRISQSPNYHESDVVLLCKWKYIGDSMIQDELGRWKIAYISVDTLIRIWENETVDTLIYDRY